jgi:hypothetical protein
VQGPQQRHEALVVIPWEGRRLHTAIDHMVRFGEDAVILAARAAETAHLQRHDRKW